MGCTTSAMTNNQPVIIGEETTCFTEAQKVLVVKHWMILSANINHIGEMVFLHIFVLQPSLKLLFPFQNLDEKSLVRDPLFKGHASRFMQAVGSVIENLDTYQTSVGPALHALGKQHTEYTGFKPDYWDVFESAINYVWSRKLGSRFTVHANEAWHMVFEFILKKLKEGYHHALQEEHAEKHRMVMIEASSKNSMTESEKVIIRKNWRHLSSNLPDCGSRIFLYIVDLDPNVKQIFPFRDLDGDDLRKDASFKAQSFRFMQAVGAVVENLDNYDEILTPMLVTLGRKHMEFHGFKPEYFEIFDKAIMIVWAEELKSKFTNESRQAWQAIFRFILSKLLLGYHQAFEEYHKKTVEWLKTEKKKIPGQALNHSLSI